MASEVIKLNLIPKGEMPVFHASQFDTGRLITCELYRGEDAYSVPEGYTVELHCRKVDNNIVTMASSSISDNVVQFASTEQLTACNGMNLCEVAILDDGYRLGTLNFWLEVEVDPLKGGITSTSEIYDLYDQIEDITEEVIGDNYYNKTQVDDLLDAKADKSTTYTKTEVNTLLNSKADTSSVYTKTETNTLLAAKADASDVYTKAQVETKLAAKADASDVYTKDETDTLLSAKADANGVYNKTEIDSMVDDLEDAIDLKADQSTTYTKTEVDTALALKANAADVYTKAETDAAIEEAIEDILPVGTAGPSAIAIFDTGYASDLVDCVTTLAPSLTGYTAVNLTACGVNLFDKTTTIYEGYINDADGNYSANANYKCTDYISIKGGLNYYILSELIGSNWGAWYDKDKNYIEGLTSYTNRVKTAPANACYARLTIWASGSGNVDTFGFNYPATDTQYHAYTGNAYAIALGDTYYGGTLYVTTGVLTVEYDSSLQPITPYDVQLSPTVVRAIVGVNNVYSDTGDITVKYKDSIQHYIDNRGT